MALALFFNCERASSAQVTRSLVGLCRICTAGVGCVDALPARVARARDRDFQILRVNRTSTSSASGSTATVTVDVWTRPFACSVTGMRCTRWTPLSNLELLVHIGAGNERQITSFKPPRSLGHAAHRLDFPAAARRRTSNRARNNLSGKQPRLVAAGARARISMTVLRDLRFTGRDHRQQHGFVFNCVRAGVAAPAIRLRPVP